ncbi:MAG: maleylpyruvate isomerase N-terminal domain-containing protein [Dehalococcoidia bacterium]
MADEVILTDKAQILAWMAERRRALQSAIDRAGPELLVRPGSWGEWTLKDLLAHLTYWQTSAIDRLQKVAAGQVEAIQLIGGNEAIDQINENVYRANRDRPLADMLEAFHSTNRSFRTSVKSLPPEAYRELSADGVFSAARTVYADGYGHDEEHLADIEKAINQANA